MFVRFLPVTATYACIWSSQLAVASHDKTLNNFYRLAIANKPFLLDHLGVAMEPHKSRGKKRSYESIAGPAAGPVE